MVDSEDEDELREEEGGGSVVDDAGLVAAHGSQAQEEDGGEEEEAQRHPSSAPSQDFDGQDLAVLMQTSRLLEEQAQEQHAGPTLTSLLETSISTAKLVM